MGGGERRGGAVEGGEGRYIGEWEGERGGEGQWREGKEYVLLHPASETSKKCK